MANAAVALLVSQVVKEEYELLRYEESKMEREFKAFAAQDEFNKKILYDLYRNRRRAPQPLRASQSQLPPSLQSADPFAEFDNEILPAEAEVIELTDEMMPEVRVCVCVLVCVCWSVCVWWFSVWRALLL